MDCFPIDISAEKGFLMSDRDDDRTGVSNNVKMGAGSVFFEQQTLDTMA